MTVTIVLLIIATVLLTVLLFIAYKLMCLMTMVVFGLDAQLSMTRSIYQHGIYSTQALRFVLDDLENRVADKIQQALKAEDFERISQYQELAKAISEMKELTDEEIENQE